MSVGLGLATILGCFEAGEKLAGLKVEDWEGEIGYSGHFARCQTIFRPSLSHLDPESLRSFATLNYPEVEKKITEWKMRLSRVPQGPPGSIYMLSQLREYLKWLRPGKRVMRDWPEFILKDATIYRRGDEIDPIVEVGVEGGDTVYMYRYNHKLKGIGMTLLDIIALLELAFQPADGEPLPGGVQIPCIYADLEPDLNWLLGLRNKDYFVGYAQQKILFGMNETGFAVREETAVAMLKSVRVEPEPYILCPNGESFLFWRRREGVEFPISLFHFTKEDFRDPGDLTKIVE